MSNDDEVTEAPEAGSPVVHLLLGANSFSKKSKRKAKHTFTIEWPIVLDHDDQWEAMLLLHVDASLLRDAFDKVPVAELMAFRKDLQPQTASNTTPNYTGSRGWSFEDSTSPRLCHRLITRLMQTIAVYPLLVNSAKTGNSVGEGDEVLQWDQVVSRTRNAMVILGVLLGSILERSFVDFGEHVMRVLCPIDREAEFCNRLFSVLLDVVALMPPDAMHDNEESARTTARAKEQGILQGVALGVLVVVAGGLENLQQNALLDYLNQRSDQVWEAVLVAFSGNTHFLCHEMSMQLLTLLLNFRKYEVRNKMAKLIETCRPADLVTCVFAMEALLTRCVRDLRSGRSSPAEEPMAQTLLAAAETSASAFITASAAVASSFGAWLAGAPPPPPPPSPDAQPASQRGSEHGSSLYGDLSANCATTMSVGHVPRLSSGRKCGLSRWVRLRFALLALYEIICSGGNGARGIQALVTHDVMPWAANEGGVLQPVACPLVVLQTLTLLSFCMQSGNGPVAKLSLIVLQCLCEDPRGIGLLFADGLADGSGLESLLLYARPGLSDALQLVPGTATLSNVPNAADSARRGLFSGTNAEAQSGCLASAIYKQLGLLLQLEVARPRHSAYFRNGDKALDGGLCTKLLDVLHRLLLYQVKRKALGVPVPQGTDWEFLVERVAQLCDAVGRSESLKGLGGEAVVLSEKLVRVLNLLVAALDGEDRHTLVYWLFKKRAAVEAWRRFLQSPAQAPRGTRLVNQEMENIRAIIMHVAKISSAEASGTGDISRETLLRLIRHNAEALQLKPHDRQFDGFHRFVEHPHESHILRAFLRQLLRDMKSVKPFVKRV